MGRCMVTPPRPSWDLMMGLGMEKPKAVADCLLAGYREWTVKGFKGREPKSTTIDPDMERADQLIEDDRAARFGWQSIPHQQGQARELPHGMAGIR